MKMKKDVPEELSSFSRKDFNELIKAGEFTSTKKRLGKETYRFIAKESNLPTVVELAYTSLQKTDPKHVTIVYAAKVAEEMQKFARTMVEGMNKDESTKGE